MKRFLSLANTLVCTSALVLSVSCSKKDDDKDKAGNSNNTNTGSLALSSDLGTAYPESLAISVFPETVDAEAASAGTIAASLTTQDEAPRTLRQKVEIQKQLLSGQAASCVPAALQNRQPKTVDSCYQFDQDMMFGYGPNGTATSGTHYG